METIKLDVNFFTSEKVQAIFNECYRLRIARQNDIQEKINEETDEYSKNKWKEFLTNYEEETKLVRFLSDCLNAGVFEPNIRGLLNLLANKED